ncbi:MAG: exo-alpha-sialidase [Candidatus Marinimicrobia bacterium]|nr:exo-alpha-sialidase [Candidatus Neomarinimicrobiota bacterium]
MTQEFIYELEDALTPSCHASTIASSGNVLVAAWFGGTYEKHEDVGIWVSRKVDDNWSIPVEVVNGVQDDGSRFPCWNPVLFQGDNTLLTLFYKVGPNPREWWGMVVTSEDNGISWSVPKRLPDGIYGPIKNKPIQLSNDDIISGTSTEHDGWKIQIERSTDGGKAWISSGDLNDGVEFSAIQPTLLVHPNETIQLLNRTKNKVISQIWSYDNGKTWGNMSATMLPNPSAGIDGLTLKDGRHLLVYNPTGTYERARVPLSVAVSTDGKEWKEIIQLEKVSDPEAKKKPEYSYPAIIQTNDELVHIVYTWKRKLIKHVVLNPNMIK